MQDSILFSHLKEYPLSEPCDIVKLLFQRHFGPGHMVTDESAVRARIEAEMPRASLDTASEILEPIGGGFFRFHLKGLDGTYGVTGLTADFLRSAGTITDSKKSGKALINELRLLPDNDELLSKAAFTKEELTAFIDSYISAGCPVISHSETYRNAYRPAYRVIRKD